MTDLGEPRQRVPHLRRSFIAPKVGKHDPQSDPREVQP